jgi:DNA methyltransferase 1-associated protein 1
LAGSYLASALDDTRSDPLDALRPVDMTSSDVRDVLNLPTNDGAPRAPKKAKPSGARPNLKGLAREVQSLGGDNPIVIAPEVAFKKRRFVNKKPAARWELRPFKNSSRIDQTLVLRHWRRKQLETTQNGAPEAAPAPNQDGGDQAMENGVDAMPAELEVEDSAFAKFNVQIKVPEYDEEQYLAHLQNADWTKEETDYMMDLVQHYDLRWPVIWDRYDYVPPAQNGETGADGDESKAIIPAPKDRSMEDLKARYYGVASKLLLLKTPEEYMTDQERNLYHIMSKFDPVAETTRKQYAAAFLGRPKEEAKEEEALLVEVRRIVARNKQFNEERRDLYRRLDYPHTDQDISSFKSSAGLQQLLQNLLAADKSKKRRSLLTADGTSPGLAIQAPPEPGAGARRDSIAATSAGGLGRRDSITAGPAQTPTATSAAKKGATQPERKKLSENEQLMYGITYHERLSSGPTFRTERVNKMFSQRSGQMQTRIANVLSELDVPSRPTIPTVKVTGQYERLVAAIITLLDARKQADKLDGELKTERLKNAARHPLKEGTEPRAQGEATTAAAAAAAAAAEGGEKQSGSAPAMENTKTVDVTDLPPDDAAAIPNSATAPGEAPPSEAGGDQKAALSVQETPAPSVEPSEVARVAPPTVEPKRAEKEKTPRPGSGHKRSASVLSTVSDKTAKRQKK